MLIVFEGVHSSGKSSQLALTREHLRGAGIEAIVTTWNSAEGLGSGVSKLKIDDRLDPLAVVCLEAADLRIRLRDGVEQAIRERVVLADRWFYTTFARGIMRGIAPALLTDVFAGVPEPDAVIWIRTPSAETCRRRIAAGLPLRGHQSGHDHEPESTSLKQTFVRYQDRLDAVYESVLPDHTYELAGGRSVNAIRADVLAAVDKLVAGELSCPC
ncbi:dTMP kinase [Nocardia rhizosphaerae]|uniref:dTMP kinase n=1 Tax=Nocardia rhizosphaerae TaxID=1691571 RepID=A0ABV8LBN1_9NOCA